MIPTAFPNEPAHPCPRVPTSLRAALCGFLAALAGGALAIPQLAKAEEMVRIVVPYRDLDLTRPLGVIALERRVHAAARTVCRHRDVTLSATSNMRRCVNNARRDAQPQIDAAVARREAVAIILRASAPSTSGAR